MRPVIVDSGPPGASWSPLRPNTILLMCGVAHLHSPYNNLPSFLIIGYNSIQLPVIVISISIYYFYITFLEYFLDPARLLCNRFSAPCFLW